MLPKEFNPDNISEGCLKRGTFIIGLTISSSTSGSATECQRACQEADECISFNFFPSELTCRLFNHEDVLEEGLPDEINTVYGPKYCEESAPSTTDSPGRESFSLLVSN